MHTYSIDLWDVIPYKTLLDIGSRLEDLPENPTEVDLLPNVPLGGALLVAYRPYHGDDEPIKVVWLQNQIVLDLLAALVKAREARPVGYFIITFANTFELLGDD